MSKLIYTAGAITGLNFNENEAWRLQLKLKIEDITSHEWLVINPCQHISDNNLDPIQKEKEGMEWDLWKIRQCELIVCDFSHPNSIGTSWELGLARELNIPVIGVYTQEKVDVHPWWKMTAMKICNNLDELTMYLCEHFLGED